jgi:hypothetical protein
MRKFSFRSYLLLGVVLAFILATFNQQFGHLSISKDAVLNGTIVQHYQPLATSNQQFGNLSILQDAILNRTVVQHYQPRILLYVTSHLSTTHEEFLHRCWPYVLSNSKLVQMADVKVFLNGDVERQGMDANVFRYVFHEKVRQNRFSIHQVENAGYQEGAIGAMATAHKSGWFEGYDWVVRVNPDVIIRDDTLILDTIMSSDEENVAGIFVDCDGHCNERTHCDESGGWFRIHSDFTVFKPSALSPALQWNEHDNAEAMNRIAFLPIVEQGQDRWLFESAPDNTGVCRLSTRDDSPVTHFGDETDGSALRCVEWFKERNLSLDASFRR